MRKNKEVSIHYLRVVTANEDTPMNLQKLATSAHQNFCSLEERSIDRNGKRYTCLDCQEYTEGFLLNVSVCTPGEPANTVPKPNRQAKANPSLINAPENEDFMDGDVHALLFGNHILICALRAHPSTLKGYLDALFAEMNTEIPEYYLAPALPAQALKALGEGVKRIDVFAAAYAAQLAEVNDSHKGFFSNISYAAFSNEKPMADAIAHKNTHAKVTVSVEQSGKIEQNTETQAALYHLAKDLIVTSNYAPYCIITKKNSKITPDKLQRKQKIFLKPYGKTVFRDEAWSALIKQKQDWEQEGLFSGSD
ncbi:MAG: hypothetical protein F8N36_04870 [Desulfovibrio sp.]|uniref:hypothetical protein n=1 Tax=Desulfovibrio sp. TaxID=885 RepID=UPI00135EDB4F|nr:hypothetical protein [Desulfovibrio sp.]MTJ92183.1 hypothetical protein [Desulfovibrio sp.]